MANQDKDFRGLPWECRRFLDEVISLQVWRVFLRLTWLANNRTSRAEDIQKRQVVHSSHHISTSTSSGEIWHHGVEFITNYSLKYWRIMRYQTQNLLSGCDFNMSSASISKLQSLFDSGALQYPPTVKGASLPCLVHLARAISELCGGKTFTMNEVGSEKVNFLKKTIGEGWVLGTWCPKRECPVLQPILQKTLCIRCARRAGYESLGAFHRKCGLLEESCGNSSDFSVSVHYSCSYHFNSHWTLSKYLFILTAIADQCSSTLSPFLVHRSSKIQGIWFLFMHV